MGMETLLVGFLKINLVLLWFFVGSSDGAYSLRADVPMGHSLVEFRVRKSQPLTSLKTNISASYRLPQSGIGMLGMSVIVDHSLGNDLSIIFF